MLLPEFFDWAGGSKGDKLANAETFPGGPAYAMARAQAIKHRIFVHAGSIMERIEGEERIHNTSVVFNREGEEIARYRKIHLFDVTTPDGASYKESQTVKPGDRVVTYDCEGVTVGCSICYDLRFPDLFQALAEKGARDHRAAGRLHAPDRQGPLGGAACAPGRSRPRLTSAPAPRPARSPSATSSATPMGIRWSPTRGDMSWPRLPTGPESSPPASTRRRSSGSAGLIPVAEHRRRLSRADVDAPTRRTAERRDSIERAQGRLGELALRAVGGHHEIISNGVFLMDTRNGCSERLLVQLALARPAVRSRLLIGGLGVGFSLAEALRSDLSSA